MPARRTKTADLFGVAYAWRLARERLVLLSSAAERFVPALGRRYFRKGNHMGVYTGHTSICTADMDAALEFYCGLLGLHVAVDFGRRPAEFLTRVPGSEMRFALLAADDGISCVELFQFFGVEQRRVGESVRHEDYWSSHVALEFDNVDEVYERLVEAGVRIDIPLTESDGYKFSYLFDPDGYMVELIAK